MTIPESFAEFPLVVSPGSTNEPGSTSRASGGDPWLSPEGIEIKPIYGAEDLDAVAHLGSWPGQAPYLRGPYPTMYTTQPWTIRQYAGFSTAEESNAFYRRNLAAGQKGLSASRSTWPPTAATTATTRAWAATSAWPASRSTRSSTCAQLFDGIPLDQMSVSMTMNGAVLPVLALYIVAAEEQGVTPEQLAGTIQNDILKEFMVRNTYIYPPAPIDADHLRHLRLHGGADAASSTRSPSPATTSRRPGRRPTWSSPTRSPTASSTSGPGRRRGWTIDAFAPRLSASSGRSG